MSTVWSEFEVRRLLFRTLLFGTVIVPLDDSISRNEISNFKYTSRCCKNNDLLVNLFRENKGWKVCYS